MANFTAIGDNTNQTIHFPGTVYGLPSLSFVSSVRSFAADSVNFNVGTVTVDADGITGVGYMGLALIILVPAMVAILM